ncbi:MAG: hypothetical protein U9R02_13330 [Thermodesulfobacteriota bacterium]|nr:hypothetical protein [Thermodesulfobacteriota bacterium]
MIDLTKKLVEYYKNNAKKRERMARFVERIGIEVIKEAIFWPNCLQCIQQDCFPRKS